MSTDSVRVSPADQARAKRLFLHRVLDHLLRKCTAADFTGHVYIKQSSKQGRLFDPETGEARHGIYEIPDGAT